MRAKSAASAARRQQAVSRNASPLPTSALMKNNRARKGKCPQKIGMWGTLSTDYKTPGMTTHDARYSQTVQNRNV